MSATTAARGRAAPRLAAAVADLRAFTWRSPDWWLGAACVLAWMGLTVMFLAMYAGGSAHGGHGLSGSSAPAGGAGAMSNGASGPTGGGAGEMSTAALIASWAVMVIAMMLPLARKRARWLAFRSLRARRQQAVTVFTSAFLAVWVVAGVAAIVVLEPVHGEPTAVAIALALAACWHRASPRRRLLKRCGVLRAPAVHGARAVADWARGGVQVGTRCVGTCGPLMLPMAILHHPALMVGAALVLVSERRPGPNPELRAGRRVEALWLAGAAMVAAAFALAA